MICSSCRHPIPDSSRFCPSCGQPVDADATQPTPPDLGEGATIAVSPTVTDRPSSSRPPAPSSSSAPPSDDGHFAAGTLIADRYRIVGLLGRGGMGDVYRADDLTLGQSVALKFLPYLLAGREDRRSRFFGEVRIARQVSHPNVCRVYDVGEVDGRPFLSMEFVDGEDLSSLLRRIGRLPHEKAIEIARQLCVGLGGLHDRGVLHRDLKPANVMIDGRGQVRITDFGLAGLTEDISGAEVRAGTPAYMAPEQLSGDGVDHRSDIYALGLVLYELFTGRRAFDADTLVEMTRMHREVTPTSPSTILPDIDPSVERVISRCLEKDPDSRPSSAVVVAAALPGGDPIAAALAAGEIPSMEMVAAAGERGGIRPAWGIACVVAAVLGVVAFAFFGSQKKIYHWDPMEKPPAVLKDRARAILADFGWTEPPNDTAHGFFRQGDVLRHLRDATEGKTRWELLRPARPAGVAYWYRESPEQMNPSSLRGIVDRNDPPMSKPGMAIVMMDTEGRLLHLQVEPPDRPEGEDPETAIVPAGDWSDVFAAAGLDPDGFAEAEPEWIPRTYVDELRAWVGHYPERPEDEIRIEAGMLGGRPVHFRTVGPWTRSAQQGAEEDTLAQQIIEVLILLCIFGILVGAVVLAVRNVRLGRGDQKGARRLSTFVFFVITGVWFLTASHSTDLNDEINLFLTGCAWALFAGTMLFAFYLALEPYVRRTWPQQLVSWGRVLAGRFRDPLVGRDILIGGAFFLFGVLHNVLEIVVLDLLGKPGSTPDAFMTLAVIGPTSSLGYLFANVINSLFNSMFFLLFLLMLHAVCRNQLVTVIVLVLLFAVLYAFVESDEIVGIVRGVVLALVWSFVLFRFGLLPFIVGRVLEATVQNFPITLDGSLWYSGFSFLAIAVVLGIVLFGLWVALSAGRQAALDVPGRTP